MAKVSTKAKSKAKLKKPLKKVAKKAVVKKKKVSAIPKGYHNVTPYLVIGGNAADAISFYKKVFNAKEVMRMQMPDGKIAHAEIKIGDSNVMIADECPEKGFQSPKAHGGSPVGMYLYMKDVDGVTKKAVKNGAKLVKAVENMFWGDRMGAVVDPYGHTWTIATCVEKVTPAQIKKRAAELYTKKP